MKNVLLSSVLWLASSTAFAGIIDTDRNSFIDETTGYEWMDYGINNSDTYEFITSQFGIGGAYEGWRLATEDDVLAMMANIFIGLGANYENANHYGTGQLKVNDGKNINGSVMSQAFEAMGYNVVIYSGHKYEYEASYGLFESDIGLGLIEQFEYTGSERDYTQDDQAQVRTKVDFSWHTTNTSKLYSTMLIKNEVSTAVPEPSSLAVFGLVSLLLAGRRFSKK